MAPHNPLQGLTGFFVYVLVVATLGPLLFGFHLAELNAPEDVIRCKPKSTKAGGALNLPQCIAMDSAQWGLVGSAFTLGGLIGALSAGPIGSKYGRLRSMQATTFFFALGPLFETVASNMGMLAFGRFVSGLGAGAAIVVVPIYISEIAPPAERGFFGSFTQIMVNTGILIAQLLGYFLSRGQYWRVILAAGGFIGVVQAIGLLLTVESPKWMAEGGRHSQAKRILRKLRGNRADLEEEISAWGTEGPEHVNEEEENLLSPQLSSSSARPAQKRENLGIFAVIVHPIHRRAVVAVMMVMLAQQFTGINSIIMYGVGLLSELLGANSALLNLVVSAVNIVVTVLCAPLVDRLGRKACLLNSITVMGVSSLLLGIGILQSIQVLSAVAVLLFVAGFALGLGPVPFMLANELVDSEAVGATQSWALAANWSATFVVAMFFPLANERLHGNVYFVFTGLALFFWIFVAWFVPESKGKKTPDEVWGRDTRRVD